MRVFALAALLALAVSALAAEPEGGVLIRYGVPRDALVTINVTRPDGWVVRELVVARPHKAGLHEAFWDGRDNLGRILPPGEYRWRMLHHPGLAWPHLVSFGNSGTPPWRTADGTGGWGGNHGQPVAVRADSSGVYLGWSSTEGPAALMKRTPDASRALWGRAELGDFGGVTRLAGDGEHLFAARPDMLWKLDPTTGETVAEVPLADTKPPPDAEPLFADPTDISHTFRPRPGKEAMIWGLAAGNGHVYVSNPWQDRIDVFDAATLTPRPERAVSVPRPRGLAMGPEGVLLAVSEGRVLAVDLETRQAKPLVAEGLDAPFDVARAPDGSLLVTDCGTHQIKRFSARGKLLSTFGGEGGGRDLTEGGPFVAEDFRYPVAVAAASDGKLWVAEDMIPKRIARLSPEGRVLYQGFGSVNYAATVAPNPKDPSEVFSTMWGLFSARIDPSEGTWRMGRILRRRWGEGGPGVLEGARMDTKPHRLIPRGEALYLWSGRALYRVEADHLKPMMWFRPRLLDARPNGIDVDFPEPARSRLLALQAERGLGGRGSRSHVILWTDENDDAAVQAEEVRFHALPEAMGRLHFGSRDMADDLALVTVGAVWRPYELTPGGVPLYRPEEIEAASEADRLRPFAGESPHRGRDGGFYALINRHNPTLPFGQGFWSKRDSENYVVGFGPDWIVRWAVGRHAVGKADRPGEIYHLHHIAGEAAGCVFAVDVEGGTHVVHRDGLYVQRLLRDPRTDRERGPDRIDCENFSGAVFTDPETGRVTYYASDTGASHVFEVRGLDEIRVTEPQPVTLEAPRIGLAARAARELEVYSIRRVPPGAAAEARHGLLPTSSIDWSRDVPAAAIHRNGVPAAEIRMLYDDTMLYVHAHVLSETPFENRRLEGTEVFDVQRAGHTVEVLLGCDSRASARRTEPVRGDMRLVFGQVVGKGEGAVVMQPVADLESEMPVARRYEGAPNRTLRHVGWFSGAQARVDRPIQGNGYVLQMAIPLVRLESLARPAPKDDIVDLVEGLLEAEETADRLLPGEEADLATRGTPDPRNVPGRKIRFDVGVTWVGANGSREKAFWMGRHAESASTGGLAAEAWLYPLAWGWAKFEHRTSAPGDGE